MRALLVATLTAGTLLTVGSMAGQGAEAQGRPDAPSARERDTTRIDLNRATARELEALPGLGPARAAAVVALRARLGGFRRIEDLLRVRGIGRATLARIRDLVVVGPRRGPAQTS